MAVMSTLLPYELIGMILDYFETDKAELAKCTLIARSWLQPGRYHLFRTLTIAQGSELDGLSAFHRFLQSERGQSSAMYIQGLGFRGVPREDDKFWEPTLDLLELGKVVHLLPRLQVVNLDSVRLSGLSLDGPAPQTCETVVRLNVARICTWTFHDLKDCVDIMHLFPGLKHFYTDNLGRSVNDTLAGRLCEYPPPAEHRPFTPKLQLQDITHRTFGPCSSLLDHFAHSFNLSSLTSLVLWYISPEEIGSVGRFLATVGRSLRLLDISLANCYIPDYDEEPEVPRALWKTLRLSKCEVLETFSLYVPLDFDPEKPGPPMDFYPHWFSAELILARLPPSVREIHLGIEDRNEPEWLEEVLHDVKWHRVAKALCRLPKLEKLYVYGEHRWIDSYRRPVDEWIRELLYAELPDAKVKGILDLSEPPAPRP